MIKKFSQNLYMKIISLVIAFILWVIVSNTINPIINDFKNITVNVINENKIYDVNKSYIIVDPCVCKINYKVNSEQASAISQSDFKVYIDLNELLTTQDLPIHFETLNNVEKYISNVSIEPTTIQAKIVDVTRMEFPVKYKSIGNLEDGHSIGSVIFSPKVVYISGSAEVLANISHISIDIPVNEKDEMFSGIAYPRVISNDGSEMSMKEIELSADEISYTATVYNRSNVTLNAKIEGNVKNGYTYAGVQIYPNSILIEGPKGTVENIFTIDLPVINIDNLFENTEYIFNIKDILPVGFKCNSTNEIKVNVTINNNVIGPQR